MRLIDADALEKDLFPGGTSGGFWGFGQLCETLDRQPTVDAEPVRHGKWMEIVTHNGCTPDYDCVCSLCGSSGAPIDDYCRGCGAKMDGE